MARDRWTLALIIICLPILATVITAFRVRDLSKAQDSSKLQTKKLQQCENCDVKVGHKVHSDKTESDKHRNEELKHAVREKQLLASQKLESKSNHKYDLRSDEDEDNDDDLGFFKIQTGFRQEIPKVRKLEKSELETSSRKSIVVKTKDYEDDDIDDDEGSKYPKVINKPKLGEIKKPSIKFLNSKHNTKNIETKATKIEPNDVDNENNDDENDDDEDNKDENVVDEHYDGLDNIEELFQILHMEKNPDLKTKQESKADKSKVQIEQKIHKPVAITIDINDDDDDDDDEDDEDDDEIAQTSIQKKASAKILSKAEREHIKKPNIQTEHDTHSKAKDDHEYHKPLLKPVLKHEKIDLNKIEKSKPKQPADSKKTEINKEEKIAVESKPHLTQKLTEDKDALNNDKEKQPLPVVKKEDSKPKEKASEEKSKPEPVKKIKDPEKGDPVPKGHDKEIKSPDNVKKLQEHDKPKEIKLEKKEPKLEKENDKNEENKERKTVHEPKKKESESMKSIEDKKDKIEFEKPQLMSKIREKHTAEKLLESEEALTSNLKYVTEAMHRRNLLKSEFEDFYSFFPTFAPNFSRIHNAECRRHGQIVLRQLRGTKLWALNMLDATAKIPSGLLQGNGIQLGDFDQCIGSRARVKLDTGSVVKVQGKYCLARVDVKAEHSELESPVYLAQAKSLIRSKIDDPGHFVPRFSTLSWGVCVPSACSSEDVEVVLKDAIKHYQHTSGVVLRVKVDEEDCYTDEGDAWEEWLELPTILTLSFYGVIVLLVLVATVQDFIARRPSEESQDEADDKAEFDQKTEDDGEKKTSLTKSSDSFLHSFSLYYTINKLTAPGTTDEIACIHGIRGIATLALLVAHKFLPVAVMPFTNRVKIAELVSSPIWSWCRAGWIFTDCFLLLSGVLTAHRIASDGNSSALKRLFSRYMRLTPALLAVVLFYAYVWDKLSAGPMWGTFVTKNADVCQEGWWWNMLYVQNYFGFEDMCAPQTHQLALDMQLTILGGIIVWVLQSAQGMAKLILPGIHLGAAYLRYSTVRDHRLTLLAYHGVSVSQLYRTARLSYMSTIHRCSPYLIGISLGLALRKPTKHGKILLSLGWLTSGALWALVLWSGFDSGSLQYRYNANFAAQYAAIAPLASAMALAWVIYAVHSGTCEFLSLFLCWQPLVFISRLSYAMYLCQFIVFITNIGTVKTSREFSFASLMDVHEVLAIMFSSIVLTLTFVIPMQSLHKIFSFSFSFQSKVNSQESSEVETAEPKSEVDAEVEPIIEEIEAPTRSRQNFLAHREVLEEIPEVELEYEMQREKSDGLDEILEEEEGMIDEEEDNLDDLEIIEEEEAGEEDGWTGREQGERSLSRNDDQDLDEWEWTSNGRNGAQHYRYAR